MGSSKRDNNLAAQALVWAIFYGDGKAAEKYKITTRTLRNYRKALVQDEQLSATFAEYLHEATRRTWGDELSAAITDMLASIRSTVASLESQTTSFDEQMAILDKKLQFLHMMLEPAITREMLVDANAKQDTKALATA